MAYWDNPSLRSYVGCDGGVETSHLNTRIWKGSSEREGEGEREREREKRNVQSESEVMSALFNFHSFLTVVLLVICTCTYLKMQFPTLLEQKTCRFRGFFWKAARIGERLSPWVAAGCFTMGVSIIFF
ncbi:uncharacterized protein LOC130793592 isoform X2 [Actinidia eriantha]|uniref:uncharacterized protein LOC130793592 isoform X2 n=1 Tax=Actinidia eriantha TaxID=165200 RepID=UPI00258690E9|nr:uncharacterized protein LOC130793592 isoform X2 [Actinidia eriantha]